jgi:TatD DNase family protein
MKAGLAAHIMELFDSHAHLDASQFDADREEVIARAANAGVTHVLTCGSDLRSSQVGVVLAAGHQGIHAAVGIHGHEAHTVVTTSSPPGQAPLLDDASFARLTQLAGQPGVVAIGEIGLDYHYNFSPPEVQRAVLARQLELAHRVGLPVILHNRESDSDLCRVVEASPGPLRGVLHCFLADQVMAEWALARGLYIGVAGPITFRNARHLPEIVRRMPLDRLLVETDCPYLAPHPKRGQRNEPAYVRFVVEGLARALNLSEQEVAERSTENARQLFRII